MPKGIDSARSDRSHEASPPLSRQADSLFLTCFRGGAVGGGVGSGAVSCRVDHGKRVKRRCFDFAQHDIFVPLGLTTDA